MTHPALRKKHRHDTHIEALLIWTYQKQKADIVSERGIGMLKQERDADGVDYPDISGDGTYQIHRNAQLGIKPDGKGKPTAQIHPDAETIHDLICTEVFTPLERGLLIDFGKTDCKPDWLPGAKPKIRPLLRKNGKPKMIYGGRGSRKPLACELEIVMTRKEIDFKREIYTRWWTAMDKLYSEIQKNDMLMTSFNAMPPIAEKAPWLWE